jgi:phage baseplate assembly protein V
MRLLHAIRTQAGSMDAGAPVARWGVVNGADPNSMTVKVMLQPEGVQTDWLPVASPMVGAGWGIAHLPANGTQVLCIPDAGDHTSYVVVGATWSTGVRPPSPLAQGDLVIQHASGARISLTSSGGVTISDASGNGVAMASGGNITLTGPVVNIVGVLKVNSVTVAVP